ncbi:MAG: hypothetical protein KGH93_03440, partial [Patescibacteria group bacterium]|nr:hypothetical protein [Patescibacteria group bacterium]
MHTKATAMMPSDTFSSIGMVSSRTTRKLLVISTFIHPLSIGRILSQRNCNEPLILFYHGIKIHATQKRRA